ncbi:hypothetical protein ACH5RR_015362 [Cinchona calisaya]|uniref:Glycosyltransferases n=1 Tax=Cinchona calisaya TaxID=153742 RepID=A0ABD2ZYB0_9GENT
MFVRKAAVMYRHLVIMKNLIDIKDRGVHQRNTTLEHIEHHKLDEIVYFSDDDNIYSLKLFESLSAIRGYSIDDGRRVFFCTSCRVLLFLHKQGELLASTPTQLGIALSYSYCN